ncbi:myo-inositol-1-phosphate synthase [Motilibacter rhizosphaerae]|uniref:Myo-inositol-1-phosphate synthase n=1 Tax=Motilibacter rhizosphaerae TaxID=598652 RepID=A0A4Q7NUD3_9ACTN|nr:inositol-3-phosphate synthase [Motilibacter rhizosphaerae]RZS90791.1 myo-inositol-1-phosphate synthase [Motilibacter rhizosphaerae]
MAAGSSTASTSAPASAAATSSTLGVAVVGLGGAVATTAVAGVELLRLGAATTDGLPFSGVDVPGLHAYTDLVFGGWDLSADDLGKAADVHAVLEPAQLRAVQSTLAEQTPWPAVGSVEFCRNVSGANVIAPARAEGESELRAQARHLVADLERFRSSGGPGGTPLGGLVVVNLASTERTPDLAAPALQTAEAFEAGLDADDPEISPAMLYAYAAVRSGCGYVNFTPSLAGDVPAIVQLAEQAGVPLAGKDGKTGQTMMKTVLAPAFRSRALRVEGWYSTNILGNRDGQALEDPASLQSKLGTKKSVLDSILGYPVEDHLVRIDYYRPRGDEKEAWDNIDLVGFLGRRMQIKVDFLCRDSVLAAPLVIELARLTALAQHRGQGGVVEELGYFFKSPVTRQRGAVPEHALHVQERVLLEWLEPRATAA